jgi:hypothetical protein
MTHTYAVDLGGFRPMQFPERTFKNSDDVCDWIADLPLTMRWAIIEGLMRKSLIDAGAETNTVKGDASGRTVWLLCATQDAALIERLLPVLDSFRDSL